MPSVTVGCIDKIVKGEKIVDPIIKVLGHKVVPSPNGNCNRYRLLIGDDEITYSMSMLATQLNYLIEDGSIVIGTLIRVKNYVCNQIPNQNKILIILVDLEIVQNEPETMEVEKKENLRPVSPPKRYDPMNTSVSTSEKTTDIIALNPYQTKWIIKGRVVHKGTIRTYNKTKAGKLFNFSLADQTGDVKVTGFNSEVDKFYDLIEMGKVYTLTRGNVKQANRQFNSSKCEYEVTLSSDSVLTECDDSEAPQQVYDFVPISKLGDKNPNEFIDLIGVVHEVADVTTIYSKNTQKDLLKREIRIVDDTNCSVSLTLWGEEARAFEGTNNPAIVCKCLKVSDFSGRSLSTTLQTTLLLDPKNFPDAARLKGWYQMEGRSIAFDAFKSDYVGGGGGSASNKLSTIQETQGPDVGADDRPVYFTVKAEPTYFKKENYLYKGCATEGCSKKLIETGTNTYRCEKCAKEGSEFTWKAILSLKMADSTGQMWAISFKETVEKILNIDVDKLGNLFSENCLNEIDDYFEEAIFRPQIFKLRLKKDTYNDETRMRAAILETKMVNYAEYNKTLLGLIKELD